MSVTWLDKRNVVYLFVVAVQSLSRIWLFAAPRTAACQASLPLTSFWNLPKFMYYVHNGILLSLKKEGNPVICNNMDNQEAIMLSQISQTHKNTVWSHLHVEPIKAKLGEAESGRMVVARGWGGENGKWRDNVKVYKVSVIRWIKAWRSSV